MRQRGKSGLVSLSHGVLITALESDGDHVLALDAFEKEVQTSLWPYLTDFSISIFSCILYLFLKKCLLNPSGIYE